MTREEFLTKNEERLKLMDKATYNRVVKDLRKMDNAQWIETYSPLFMEAGVNTDDMTALKKTVEPLPKRLREAFGDLKFAPSEKWKNRVYKQEFSDVDKEEFEKGLVKMKEYFDKEEAQRKAEADKEKRKREVKNWGWRNFIASDYEKERYLDNPNAALFGEQAPKIGEAPETRWGSAADLGMGVAGAAGDVVPGWGSILAGPGIRAVRDVGHKVTDSPYQKDWTDIGKGFMQDAAFNAATFAVPNFKRARKVANKVMPTVPENVTTYKNLEDEVQAVVTGLNAPVAFSPEAIADINVAKGLLGTKYGIPNNLSMREIIDNPYGIPPREQERLFREAVGAMPESPTKKSLTTLLEDNEIDYAKAAAIANNDLVAALNAANPEMRDAFRATREKYGNMSHETLSDVPFFEGQDPIQTPRSYHGPKLYSGRSEKLHPYYRTILSTPEPTAKDLKTAERAATASKLYDQFSDAAVNLPATFFNTRPTGKAPTRVETDEERDEIEAIKEREAPFWKMKFKPHKDNSLMYQAWKEWAEENGVEVKD